MYVLVPLSVFICHLLRSYEQDLVVTILLFSADPLATRHWGLRPLHYEGKIKGIKLFINNFLVNTFYLSYWNQFLATVSVFIPGTNPNFSLQNSVSTLLKRSGSKSQSYKRSDRTQTTMTITSRYERNNDRIWVSGRLFL